MGTIDKKLTLAILTIIIFGIIMVFSSAYPTQGITPAIKQLGAAIIAFAITSPLLFSSKNIKIKILAKYNFWIYAITFGLLLLVFFPLDGNTVNGSTRWIAIPPVKFQPSEMAKLTVIIAMANMIAKNEVRSISGAFYASIIIIPIATLLLFETDFGATFVITSTALVMLFAAGTKMRYLIATILIVVILLMLLIYINDNRFDRIIAFISGTGSMDDQRSNAMVGIVRGGLFGVGIGASLQKINILSESHNDMIFAIIGEETGVLGMLLVISLYIYIFYKGLTIAQLAIKRGFKFHSYLATGITFLLSLQTALNLSVNLSLFPPKGITLPLISYGGSSMLFTMMMMVILLKIDMEIQNK